MSTMPNMTLLWLSALLLSIHPDIILASPVNAEHGTKAKLSAGRVAKGAPTRQLAFTMKLPTSTASCRTPGAQRRQLCSISLSSSARDNNNKEVPASSINEIEREVLESTRSKMDLQMVRSHFLGDEYDDRDQLPLPRALQTRSQPVKSAQHTAAGQRFAVAVASGTTCALACYIATHSVTLGSFAFGAAWWVALGDPMEEEGPAGAVSRIIGRTTLQSLEQSSPKVRAVARAVVDGDDPLQQLKSRIHTLEADKAILQRQLQQRTLEDELLKTFTVKELRELARERDLPASGNKVQLVERLVDHGELTSFSVLLEKPENRNL